MWAPRGQTRGVIEFTINKDRIIGINVVGDAERLRQLDIVTLEG